MTLASNFLVIGKKEHVRVIPPYNQSGFLPPFQGNTPTDPAAMAPYNVPLLQVADRFGTSKERIEILKGLIAYRDELRTAGFLNGFQWLDGSFMENVEKNRSRPPGDIDVVTFSHRPVNV